MCSVSWLHTPEGYQVFFNRDELKSRPLALPPRQETLNATEVLMPVDPVGRGSWISVNQHGITLCLLNNYQGQTPEGRLISRGQLVRHLASAVSAEEAADRLMDTPHARFAPFTLLIFTRHHHQTGNAVIGFEWNGQQLTQAETGLPVFSSAVDLRRVTDYRRAAYDRHFTSFATPDSAAETNQAQAFHCDHAPDQPHLSVCMHRTDAQTVSFTQVTVTEVLQEMIYIPGSPCCNLTPQAMKNHCYTLLPANTLSTTTAASMNNRSSA